MKYAARLEFKATNNITEYECLILGLNKVKALGAKIVQAKTDSQVVAGQVKKTIHGTRARAGQIHGDSKDTRAEVPRVYFEVHTKSKKLRGG
jgi:ribonuclease HI